MASSAIVSEPQVSVGRVFSRAFAVIGGNPLTMFGIAFVFGALPSLVVSYFRQQLTIGIMDRYSTIGVIGLSIGGALIGLILSMLVQGALVRATVAFTEGRRASFGESAAAGLSVALPLLGLAILMAIVLAVGFVLLIVPAVILYIMWSVASPALVEERTGVIGAFSRSQALTSGARWKVFGLELIVLVFYWLLSGVVGVVMLSGVGLQGMAAIGQNGLPIWWLVTTAILSTLVTTFWSTIQTSLYVELRDWKDGPASQRLEDIFA